MGKQVVSTIDQPLATTMLPKRDRTWPAILALYVFAPIWGEVFSLNTPILKLLIDPGSLIFIPALYGSGALVVREVVRRRGLGWPNVLLLGAAYGVLEEGLDVQSWFNPRFTALGTLGVYGRAWETNWVWALGLTVFHAVFSISIPILLAERCFPRVAARPWLGRKGLVVFAALLTFTCLLGFFGNGFILFRKVGYTHPPLLPLLFATALMVGLFVVGQRLVLSPRSPAMRPPPRLWTLRLFGFAMAVAYFFAFYGMAGLQPYALVAMGSVLLVVAFVVVRVRSWARRAGWGARHELALATGACGLGLVVSPLGTATGLPIVALAFLILLIWLARVAPPPGPLPSEEGEIHGILG